MLCHSILNAIFIGAAFLILFVDKIDAQVPFEKKFTIENPRKRISALPRAAANRKVETNKLEEILSELKKSPDDPIVLNNLAVAYALEGRLKEALSASLRSVSISDKFAATQLNLASIYDRLGQTDEARLWTKKAITLDPTNLNARIFYCDIDFGLERYDEAGKCFRGVVGTFPDDLYSRLKLGISLLRTNQLDEARPELEKVRIHEPQNIYMLNALGVVLYKQKKYKDCAAVFKEATEIEPEKHEIRFNLAACYLALGNRPGALSQYNLLKTSHPETAKQLYQALFKKYVVQVNK